MSDSGAVLAAEMEHELTVLADRDSDVAFARFRQGGGVPMIVRGSERDPDP